MKAIYDTNNPGENGQHPLPSNDSTNISTVEKNNFHHKARFANGITQATQFHVTRQLNVALYLRLSYPTTILTKREILNVGRSPLNLLSSISITNLL